MDAAVDDDAAEPMGEGERPARALLPALRRGFVLRCPPCGEGALFGKYLKSIEHCAACGEAMHHHRADDAPPYVTILVVGHVVLPLMLLAERWWAPPTWLQLLVWLSVSCWLIYFLLPRFKGALIGLQWAWRMHGFDEAGDGGGDT